MNSSAGSAEAWGESAWRLWTAPGLSRMGEPALLLFGVDLGASLTLGPGVVLADLQARWGAKDMLPAEVGVQAYSASVALSPALSAGVFDVTIGPGVRLGYARLSGRPDQAMLEGRSLGAAWFGPLAATSVQWRLAPWAAVRAAFELGYVAKPVRGLDEQSQRLLELRGVWTSASLGAALLLPPYR